VWTLLVVAVAPIALWLQLHMAFAVVAALTLAGLYGVQLWGARIPIGLLEWGRVATVTDSETLSRATYYSGTTWYNVYLPMAHGWTVTRQRWSGPNTKIRVGYTLDGHRGNLVVRGREYTDGVILADERRPERARCVTSFAYNLDRDAAGNWVGKLRPRLRIGIACWSVIVIGWLVLAGLTATGFRTDLPAAARPPPSRRPVRCRSAETARRRRFPATAAISR
jgi:hypothetical protein